MALIMLPSLVAGGGPIEAPGPTGAAAAAPPAAEPARPMTDAELQAEREAFLQEYVGKPFTAPLARILLVFGPIRGSELIGTLIARQPLVILPLVILLIGIAAFAVLCGITSRMSADIADYRQPGFAEFVSYARETWTTSLLFVLVLGAYLAVILVAFPFYAGRGVIGWLAIGLLFWVTVAAFLAGQYFFPIQSRLDRKFRKIFRKSFLLLFDNTMFTFGLLVAAMVVFGVSVFTAFLIPGMATLFLLWNAALKLRLYKYDWLEENPGADRRKVPWDALLIDDRERVGKRTLKGMIFPWKE
jgi:hypothetical protein